MPRVTYTGPHESIRVKFLDGSVSPFTKDKTVELHSDYASLLGVNFDIEADPPDDPIVAEPLVDEVKEEEGPRKHTKSKDRR